MNKRNCVKCSWEPISKKCDLCDRNVTNILEASNFFRRTRMVLCREHTLQWVKGELNV